MIKKLNDILAGIPATVVAGIFLVLKLILQYVAKVDVPIFLDPAWIAVVITGIPLLYLAIWRIIYNPGISKISSALLICMGMAACIFMTFLTGHDELFAAGEIGLIMSIGAILEDKTTEHARSGLKKLISLNPEQGRRIVDGKEEMVPVEQIAVGDILRVNPGEVVCVDGVIVSGMTSVDQSVMTGESLPVDKEVGDEVFCGTMNRFGSVDIRATKVGKDSSLQKLIKMVEDADNQKAPIARIADKAASRLVPLALLIAIVAIVVTGDLEKGVTILVVFCPCALVLATPTAVMAGIGQATRHGVIIKSGEALEKMGKVDTIAFDKTGTLTYGKLMVSDVVSFSGVMSEGDETEKCSFAETSMIENCDTVGVGEAVCLQDRQTVDVDFNSQSLDKVNANEIKCPQDWRTANLDYDSQSHDWVSVGEFVRSEGGRTADVACGLKNDEILSIAAAAETRSEHPLGKAIVEAARSKHLDIPSADDFSMESGKGVKAVVSGKQVLCGNSKFMQENQIAIPDERAAVLDQFRTEGKASILVAENGKMIGAVALSDVLRENAADMVQRLHALQVKSVLLTGDHQKTADYFARRVGISDIRAELLPEEKVAAIRNLRESGARVCMIGDGVNDAPALKTADIGVAMGSMGSDIAVEAADVALMSDDISKIPYLKKLSNITVKTIKTSIGLSLVINAFAITFSLMGILNPTTGALWHNVGSCLVVLLAASLYDRKIE